MGNGTELEGLIRFFVNTLAIRVRLDGGGYGKAEGAEAGGDGGGRHVRGGRAARQGSRAGSAGAPGRALRGARRPSARRAAPRHQPHLPSRVKPL